MPKEIELEEDGNGQEPWGDEFDAQRAWNKIQALTADNNKLKNRPLISEEQLQMLDEYKVLVEASQTDQERQQAQIESLSQEAGQVPTLTAENLRLQVALDKGLSSTLAKRLQGTSREEMEADAEALLGLIGTGTQPQGMRPNPAQGTSGAGTPSLDDQIAVARKEGKTRTAVQLELMKLQEQK